MSKKHVLLLRLSGPLQAWGVDSRFAVRDTLREPSKSGVLGLVCAALGRSRDHPIHDLAALRMGVRADQEGTVLRDYHVAGVGGYMRASGTVERKTVIPGNRYYLADARFLVALEGGDDALLNEAHEALRDPVWPLFLGRKACPPGEPVWLADGLQPATSLDAALEGYPWLAPAWIPDGERPHRLRLVLEDPEGPQVRPDQPLSFAQRRFANRRVSTTFCPRPSLCLEEVNECTSPA